MKLEKDLRRCLEETLLILIEERNEFDSVGQHTVGCGDFLNEAQAFYHYVKDGFDITKLSSSNLILADGILFRDWFVDANVILRLGFLRQILSVRIWQLTYQHLNLTWNEFICDDFSLEFLKKSLSCSNILPNDFRMFVNFGYLGLTTQALMIRKFLLNATSGRYWLYLNTSNEIVMCFASI